MSDRPRPACYGDRRFTTTSAADVNEAIAICETCIVLSCQPILAELLADKTAASVLEGVWDGRYYGPDTRPRRAVA